MTYDDDDSIGVRRDTLVDARVELESDLYCLREMYVMLDGMADDMEGIWTSDDRATMRRQQEQIRDLIDLGEETRADIDDELARVKQEAADDDHSG
jgi:hypothetical protein